MSVIPWQEKWLNSWALEILCNISVHSRPQVLQREDIRFLSAWCVEVRERCRALVLASARNRGEDEFVIPQEGSEEEASESPSYLCTSATWRCWSASPLCTGGPQNSEAACSRASVLAGSPAGPRASSRGPRLLGPQDGLSLLEGCLNLSRF